MCGEHTPLSTTIPLISGSSPHVRGTPARLFQGRFRWRFIPACAGNTVSPIIQTGHETVHPRMCGEHGANNQYLCPSTGSSPHVRGTQVARQILHGYRRFIPACAGNTGLFSLICFSITVHPRMCGEHDGSVTTCCLDAGSSPHVRGTRCTCGQVFPRLRFIPACAGNTSCYGSTQIRHPVHPRMCGEHPPDVKKWTGHNGSSPHVRGTPAFALFIKVKERFIPACAGNTKFEIAHLG